MAETTRLDAAYLRMTDGDAADAAQLDYYATLADTPPWVLLEREQEGEEAGERTRASAGGDENVG